jgi:hypothetical protein
VHETNPEEGERQQQTTTRTIRTITTTMWIRTWKQLDPSYCFNKPLTHTIIDSISLEEKMCLVVISVWLLFVLFYVLCVNVYCRRVTDPLQLNISYVYHSCIVRVAGASCYQTQAPPGPWHSAVPNTKFKIPATIYNLSQLVGPVSQAV